MDTMKLLLGTIIAVLLAAVVMSWNGMQWGVKNAPSDEAQRLSRQIEAIKAEQDRLALERQLLQQHNALAVAPPGAPTTDPAVLNQPAEVIRPEVPPLAAGKAATEPDATVLDPKEPLLAGGEVAAQRSRPGQGKLIRQAPPVRQNTG